MTKRLVVVGDALLDVDVVGVARRLSPDAPVPVLDDLVEHPRPGGAALAALMAARDGHAVTLVTAVGDDAAGRQLVDLLPDVRVVPLGYDGPTPVKRRIRSGGQSLVRLDSGTSPGRFADVPGDVSAALAGADCVLVSDYGRGVTAVTPLRDLLESLQTSVPIVWDPHPRGSVPVRGCHLVTPNRSEAVAFASSVERAQMPARQGENVRSKGREGPAGTAQSEPQRGISASVLANAHENAVALVSAWRAHAVAVTLGSKGALLTYGSGAPSVSPAPDVHCVDPCGAGDRFAVTAVLELASGKLPTEAVAAAVAAASAYVAAGGPTGLLAPPSSHRATSGAGSDHATPARVASVLDPVRASGGTVVAAGGCFDLLHAGHIATLQSARSLGDCLVVCLNSDASVRRLKGARRPLVGESDRAKVLAALECVDAVVVFEEDTPEAVLERLRPDIWVKGGDYAGIDVPEAAVLDQWGGQVVTLPYLAGRSTSQLAIAAAGSSGTPTTPETKELHS